MGNRRSADLTVLARLAIAASLIKLPLGTPRQPGRPRKEPRSCQFCVQRSRNNPPIFQGRYHARFPVLVRNSTTTAAVRPCLLFKHNQKWTTETHCPCEPTALSARTEQDSLSTEYGARSMEIQSTSKIADQHSSTFLGGCSIRGFILSMTLFCVHWLLQASPIGSSPEKR